MITRSAKIKLISLLIISLICNQQNGAYHDGDVPRWIQASLQRGCSALLERLVPLHIAIPPYVLFLFFSRALATPSASGVLA